MQQRVMACTKASTGSRQHSRKGREGVQSSSQRMVVGDTKDLFHRDSSEWGWHAVVVDEPGAVNRLYIAFSSGSPSLLIPFA